MEESSETPFQNLGYHLYFLQIFILRLLSIIFTFISPKPAPANAVHFTMFVKFFPRKIISYEFMHSCPTGITQIAMPRPIQTPIPYFGIASIFLMLPETNSPFAQKTNYSVNLAFQPLKHFFLHQKARQTNNHVQLQSTSDVKSVILPVPRQSLQLVFFLVDHFVTLVE